MKAKFNLSFMACEISLIPLVHPKKVLREPTKEKTCVNRAEKRKNV